MARLALIAAALAAATVPAIAALDAAPPAAKRDWSGSVVMTAEGGFRMGSPSAPLKLVEYGSMTCSHCAHFSREGVPAMMPAIRAGRLSYEFRNFVRDPADVAAAMVARCTGAAGFFPTIDRMFAAQQEWVGRAAALPQAEADKIAALPPATIPARYAQITGVRSYAAGLGPARADTCLRDRRAIDRLLAIRKSGVDLGVSGTPAFTLNGKLLDKVFNWTMLQPHLGLPPG